MLVGGTFCFMAFHMCASTFVEVQTRCDLSSFLVGKF